MERLALPHLEIVSLFTLMQRLMRAGDYLASETSEGHNAQLYLSTIPRVIKGKVLFSSCAQKLSSKVLLTNIHTPSSPSLGFFGGRGLGYKNHHSLVARRLVGDVALKSYS